MTATNRTPTAARSTVTSSAGDRRVASSKAARSTRSVDTILNTSESRLEHRSIPAYMVRFTLGRSTTSLHADGMADVSGRR